MNLRQEIILEKPERHFMGWLKVPQYIVADAESTLAIEQSG